MNSTITVFLSSSIVSSINTSSFYFAQFLFNTIKGIYSLKFISEINMETFWNKTFFKILW